MTDAQTTYDRATSAYDKDIAAAEQNADIQELVRRTFNGTGAEGAA
jgi:hypothetical protein